MYKYLKCYCNCNQYGIDHGSKNFNSMRVLMQQTRMKFYQNIFVVLLILLHSCNGNAFPRRVYKKVDGNISRLNIYLGGCYDLAFNTKNQMMEHFILFRYVTVPFI